MPIAFKEVHLVGGLVTGCYERHTTAAMVGGALGGGTKQAASAGKLGFVLV